MKLDHLINFWKLNIIFYILFLMKFYNNYSKTAYTYLSLHGSYGLLWTWKSFLFPDKSFVKNIGIFESIYSSIYLLLYWTFPYMSIKYNVKLTNLEIFFIHSLYTIGIFLHFCSDCQKYYTLKYKKKFINDGFFHICRNPNYLGELLIYLSFVLCTKSLICLFILLFNIILFWIPRMIQKDENLLKKYNDFKYIENFMFIPLIW